MYKPVYYCSCYHKHIGVMVGRIGSKKADNLLSATAVKPIIYIELRVAFRIRLKLIKFLSPPGLCIILVRKVAVEGEYIIASEDD